VQVWEQQLQQTKKAWNALHNRLSSVIAAAEQHKQQQQEQAAASPMGVRGLAASRAQGRQVSAAHLYGLCILGYMQPWVNMRRLLCGRLRVRAERISHFPLIFPSSCML
jgi:hypothetical protein